MPAGYGSENMSLQILVELQNFEVYTFCRDASMNSKVNKSETKVDWQKC